MTLAQEIEQMLCEHIMLNGGAIFDSTKLSNEIADSLCVDEDKAESIIIDFAFKMRHEELHFKDMAKALSTSKDLIRVKKT